MLPHVVLLSCAIARSGRPSLARLAHVAVIGAAAAAEDVEIGQLRGELRVAGAQVDRGLRRPALSPRPARRGSSSAVRAAHERACSDRAGGFTCRPGVSTQGSLPRSDAERARRRQAWRARSDDLQAPHQLLAGSRIGRDSGASLGAIAHRRRAARETGRANVASGPCPPGASRLW